MVSTPEIDLIVHALRELGAKPAEAAAGVGERLARAMASVGGNDPDRLVWHRVAGGVSEPWGSAWQAELPAATAALRALRPGDVVPAGVVTERPRRGGPHPSHSLRSSDASTFDVICTACGHTDVTPGSWGALVDPCPAPPEEGMPA
jgi:hypothetical protein